MKKGTITVRKFLCIVLQLCFISGCAQIPSNEDIKPYLSAISTKSASKSIPYSFAKLAQLKYEDFDLCNAVLFVSKQIDPDVDIQANTRFIDEMAAELACRLNGKTDYNDKISIFNDFIFNKGFVCPNPFWKNYYPEKFGQLWYIDCSSFTDFLKKKQGNCLTMSMLYLILAEKTGVPLYGVAIPGHLFIRYDDGVNKRNIETTARGFDFTDEDYIESYGAELGNLRNYYLCNLSAKQFFGCFMLNSGTRYYLNNNMKRALFYYMVGNNFNPLDPSLLNCIAEIYFLAGDYDNAITAYSKELNINPYNPEAYCKIGLIYLKKGNQEEAKRFFYKATMEKPHNLNEFFHKGIAFYCLGVYDKSLKYFLRINELYKNHYDSLYFTACVYSIKGNERKSIDYLEKAISINRRLRLRAQSEEAFSNLKKNQRFLGLITL